MTLMQGSSIHAKKKIFHDKKLNLNLLKVNGLSGLQTDMPKLNFTTQTLQLVPGHFLQTAFHHGFPKKIKPQLAQHSMHKTMHKSRRNPKGIYMGWFG